MASEFGELIRRTRLEKGIGLRELARRIEKSASFVVGLEAGEGPPSASESTLRKIASVLELDSDRIITMAGKVPEGAAPADALEVALFRRMRQASEKTKKRILRELEEQE